MTAGRTFVLGDVHGAYKAMVQCLDRANFKIDEDTLIFLGDVIDGYPEIGECLDLLKSVNASCLRGNHDQWAIEYYYGTIGRQESMLWFKQGGEGTLRWLDSLTPERRANYLKYIAGWGYYRVHRNMVFVHGGYDPRLDLEVQGINEYLWWRNLEYLGKHCTYDAVYVGHTCASYGFYPEEHNHTPQKIGKLWAMDTGAGYGNVLSMMDIDTHEVFQSDRVDTLYPGHKPR